MTAPTVTPRRRRPLPLALSVAALLSAVLLPAAFAAAEAQHPDARPAATAEPAGATAAPVTHGGAQAGAPAADHPAAHDAAGGHEKPELVPKAGAVQVITSVVTLLIFLLLVGILSKYAWGPIVSGLKAREDKIRRDIRDAEEARLRSEQALKQYQAQLATAEVQVRDLIAKASADAQQIATTIKMHAQQEAEEAKERAVREIEQSKNQALAEVYEQTANLATSIAEKILRRNLNADDQRELVRNSLEQLKGVNAN